ncbi:MAG TPA: hypothetical protein IAB38_03275 [Candidatus Onthousia excrementipullorum]|uniref:DUF6273 domain-containing protein n=1 Tax=Candidatus Onthousia excrementipullorum TaxID=2840884 RepID=A0A9D1J383_9FIRM|nr:hypothetical protein [Candidatus Onthousia excrementipullorum]
MKKILLETSFSKIYMIAMIIVTLLILGGYFSYAMFTVSKEKSNAISIVTGNLTYKLEVDGEEGNILTVPSNTVKDFTITLSNPNNRTARFNFYYVGALSSNTKVGYIAEEGTNPLPDEKGIKLEKVDTTGSSNTYIIRVINNSGKSVTVNLGVSVGLDYNDLTLPENGHLFEEITYKGEVGTVVLSNISEDNIYDDGVDTFTTGEYPNNYIWYSGKLWRAVSVNNEENTVKLVTEWNISSIVYSSGSTDFEGSYMEEWLNDTSVDGFLCNLRETDNFIVTDAVWDATMDARALGSFERPDGTTVVEDAVGLLNMYEYQTSYNGTTYSNGYLNNGLYWWTLTPYSSSDVRTVYHDGSAYSSSPSYASGLRPSINLKSSVHIVDGDGTISNPYRLNGDNDTNLSGALLSSRYSGEYIRFGNDENNLYRIVSHENGSGTKITSAEPLKDSGTFITSAFGSNTTFSSTNTIGIFLNGEYLTSYVDSSYANMIEDSTTWYIGTVGYGNSYKLAKYTDATGTSTTSNVVEAKVGLLRFGELMAGQFDRYAVKGGTNSKGLTTTYWILTPNSMLYLRSVNSNGNANDYSPSYAYGIKPVLNLKSNVIITSGDGTLQNPFQIALE